MPLPTELSLATDRERTGEWIRYHAEREHELLARISDLENRIADLEARIAHLEADRDTSQEIAKAALDELHALTVKLQRTQDSLRRLLELKGDE